MLKFLKNLVEFNFIKTPSITESSLSEKLSQELFGTKVFYRSDYTFKLKDGFKFNKSVVNISKTEAHHHSYFSKVYIFEFPNIVVKLHARYDYDVYNIWINLPNGDNFKVVSDNITFPKNLGFKIFESNWFNILKLYMSKFLDEAKLSHDKYLKDIQVEINKSTEQTLLKYKKFDDSIKFIE